MSPTNSIRCRDITDSDAEGVIDLLTLGFADQRARSFWERALAHLARRVVPEGYPRYGCLMESEGRIVGAILQIFTPVEGTGRIRCNFSSWWVMPDYRAVGSLLVSRAFRHKVTYTNITPAPQTLPILEAQGYKRYCSGRVIGIPAFSTQGFGARVRAFDAEADKHLDPKHWQILHDHETYDCISLVAERDGQAYPFVFARRSRARIVRLAMLVYCAESADVTDFAGALGRYLFLRGYPLMVIDANGDVPGLCGRFFDGKPKYFRGPDQPRVGDQAYTERALFGS